MSKGSETEKISNPIFKINYLIGENKIHTIFVFYGEAYDSKSKNPIENLFKIAPQNQSFLDPINKNVIFSEKEMNEIREKSIPVIFSDQQIHLDDSIGSIKIKIINEFSKINKRFSLEEVYLYCQKYEELNSVSVYDTLTQNNKIKLNKVRLDQFLKNIINKESNKSENFEIENKEYYDYNDILNLNINKKKFIINKVLGQKFFIINNEYPFVCDPFTALEYDDFIERVSRKTLTTLNSHLLLNTGIPLNNTIYLCLAEDVLKLKPEKKIQEYTIKIYYPKIFSKNINSLEELNNNKEKLLEDNKNQNLLSESVKQNFKNVDLFYDIFKYKKTNLNYKDHGIKYIKFILKPDYNIKIPLDVIFKLLHATETTPLIKYNASIRQEKLYRLYADKISTDGRKIPFLPKANIFKLMKTIGKNKSVSVYINNNDFSLECEFEENGNIVVFSQFEKAVDIYDINNRISKTLNPIIEEIKDYIEQSGYNISLFDSLLKPNIEIKQLTYETIIHVSKEIKLADLKGCMSSIFITESTRMKKEGIHLRFKRVSNFNKRTSQEAFIIEKQKEGYNHVEIINKLVENYDDLNRKDAEELYSKLASELQVERGVKRNDIEIKINPGFPVIIKEKSFSNDIVITVENINDILYLETIPIYLDSLIRLTQDKSSTKVESKKIKGMCSSDVKDEIDIPIIDTIASIEKSIDEQEIPIIEGKDEDIDLGFHKLSDYESSQEGEEKAKNAISMFFGDEDEEEEEDEIYGGKNSADSKDKTISSENSENSENSQNIEEYDLFPNAERNIQGMPLSNKNSYFQNRIAKYDPVLIIKNDTPRYNSYSRICTSTSRRQPIILTKDELNKINEEHKGYLQEGDIIHYGSKPDKDFYYICPRYWDLKRETIVTEKEMKEKNLYDKIIPKKAKKVPEGKYIYEFQDTKQYPGFVKEDSHPDGYCLPCCFKNWDTAGQLKRRNKCMTKEVTKEMEEEEDELVSETREKNDKEEVEIDNYIKGPEKFPLQRDRWGYLPTNLQLILKQVNADCQISKSNTNIKPNHACLLRHGVELSNNQSFIACISDALFYTKRDEQSKPIRKSIEEMKEIIISGLNVDNFIRYQNGNLISDFKEPNRSIDIEKYKSSIIYEKLKKNNTEENVNYFKNICSSFENFIYFLKSSDSKIDYTYLWDLICENNPNLFKNGLNLIILNIPDDDTTNNVNIVCPTNHYSEKFYDPRKPSLLLLQKGEFFEPIYSYKYNTTKKNAVTEVIKFFSEFNPHLSSSMKDFFQKVIKPYIEGTDEIKSICKPNKSMPSVYKMEPAIPLNTLISKLNKMNYKIIKQVINYSGKVIGLVVEKPTENNIILRPGFVPCYPSSINSLYDYVLMTEYDLWNNYDDTLTFLKKLYKNSRGEIKCKPVFNIVEDEFVIGIITETNQFIQLSEPYPVSNVRDDDIRLIRDNNYIVKNDDKIMQSDAIISTSNETDKEREEYVKKIKLETNFLDVFRNVIRILLNDYINADIREEIENILNNKYDIYNKKLASIDKLLRKLVERNNSIKFIDIKYSDSFSEDVNNCIINKTEDKCKSKGSFCKFIVDNKVCQLIIPRFNLLHPESNNEIYYFARMADEIIRYSRIRSFIFKPQTYLLFGNIGYNLRSNEIILLESLITQEYFEELKPAVINKFVKYNSYDEVEPIVKPFYNNVVEFSYEKNNNSDNKCGKIVTPIKTIKWKGCFPNKYKEVKYDASVYCTYYFIIDLIKEKTQKVLTVNDIKSELLEEYKKFLPTYEKQIIEILIKEGKKLLGQKVKSKVLSFDNLIFTENYFLTTLDYWLLLEKYQIPTIFLSSKIILETAEKYQFVAYGNREDKFAFIMIPFLKPENIPSFKLIQSLTNDIFISLDQLIDCDNKKDIYDAFENKNKITVENFIQNYKKKILVIKNDSETISSEKIVEPQPQVIENGDKEILNPNIENNTIIIEPNETLNIQPKPKTKPKTIREKKIKTNVTRKLKIL
jgi:hypothetical protein